MTRSSLKTIYFFGAIAMFLSALVFRRNISAELSLFITEPSPSTAVDWFALLQSNSLLGVGLLNIFDSVNYLLLGIMFAALYFTLRQTSPRLALSAMVIGFSGIAVYLASNTAFSMLSLNSQYVTAATDTQKMALLSAGETILSSGDPGAVYEGLGGIFSFSLIAAASALVCIAMYRSRTFNRATAYVGLVASTLDLAYIAGLFILPKSQVPILSATCLATAGLLLLVWHLIIGVKLLKLSKTTGMGV